MDNLVRAIRLWLMQSFVAAGHKLTGSLINDADIIAETFGKDIRIETWIYKYGEYLERGVKATNIPYYKGSGRKHSLYIEGLMNYVAARMKISNLKRQKSIAFAIAETQKTKKKGMPISTRGRGTSWLTKMLDRHDQDVLKFVEQWADKEMEIIFDNFIRESQKKLSTS